MSTLLHISPLQLLAALDPSGEAHPDGQQSHPHYSSRCSKPVRPGSCKAIVEKRTSMAILC